jgi:hypothetical protein
MPPAIPSSPMQVVRSCPFTSPVMIWYVMPPRPTTTQPASRT